MKEFDTNMKYLLTIYAYFRYNFVSKIMDLNHLIYFIEYFIFSSTLNLYLSNVKLGKSLRYIIALVPKHLKRNVIVKSRGISNINK